jgi:uncharacterized protein (UPF0332 family)
MQPRRCYGRGDSRTGKHSGVHAAFGEHYAKTGLDPKYHRWLLDAFDERLRGDYDFQSDFDLEAITLWVEQAREFLSVARRYLEGSAKTSD